MFRRLAVNTGVSAMAYLVTSVVGFLLVPALVSAYGLKGFGMITLSRLFLPTGGVGLFDFGFGETATQLVAGARGDGRWDVAGRRLAILLIGALVMGAILAGGLWLLSGKLTSWFHIETGSVNAFRGVLKATGLFLALAFPGLVLEGAVKGYELYPALRSTELIGTLGYAASAVAFIRLGWPFTAVVYVFLGSLCFRILAFAYLFFRKGCFGHLSLHRWTAADLHTISLRCRLMAWNKVLGAFQGQGAPLLIGTLLQPTAVGIYEVLTRLPKFAKSVLGLINSALLPVATRMEASGDREGIRLLGELGLVLVTALCLPILVGAGFLSKQLLGIWIGPELKHWWIWQSLMFVIPAANLVTSFGGTMLLVRNSAVAKMNRLVTLQVILQFGLSVLLSCWYQERGFILGQVLAVGLTFSPQVQHIFREQGVPFATWKRLGVVGLASLLMGAGLFLLAGVAIHTLAQLLLIGFIWLLAVWAILIVVCFTKGERDQVLRFLTRLRPVPRGV